MTTLDTIIEGVAAGTVTQQQALEIINAQYKPKRMRFQYTQDELNQAHLLHCQGLSIRQVASKLNCDRKTLKDKLVDNGFIVRDHKASQAARRKLEGSKERDKKEGVELKRTDVMSWGAHELFRNGK